MVTIQDARPGVSPEFIDEFETKLDCKLPMDYREFIMTHNGGIPTPFYFDFNFSEQEIETLMIDQFLYLGDDNTDFGCISYHLRKSRHLIQEEMLPIGTTPWGLIYIVVRGGKAGEVYVEINWIPVEDGNRFFVSKDFTEFLDSLHSA